MEEGKRKKKKKLDGRREKKVQKLKGSNVQREKIRKRREHCSFFVSEKNVGADLCVCPSDIA